MEQRQDYVESQIDMLSKVLRKLLEKLLGIKNDDLSELELNNIFATEISVEKLKLSDLKKIADVKLIETLVETYHYDNQNIKLLADVLYVLSKKIDQDNFDAAKKALVLYTYYIDHAKGNIDFVAFSRKEELSKTLA